MFLGHLWKILIPGNSIRDQKLHLPVGGHDSNHLKGSLFHSPSQKGHKLAELPGSGLLIFPQVSPKKSSKRSPIIQSSMIDHDTQIMEKPPKNYRKKIILKITSNSFPPPMPLRCAAKSAADITFSRGGKKITKKWRGNEPDFYPTRK